MNSIICQTVNANGFIGGESFDNSLDLVLREFVVEFNFRKGTGIDDLILSWSFI